MDGQNQPSNQAPHIGPALAAVIITALSLVAFDAYARLLEHRLIRALAADQAIIERNGKLAPVKNQGTALQKAAIETAGLLPVYGSSELNVQAAYNRPFHATNLFHDQPTGFTVFPVGKAGTTSLIILQKLAALGPALQGRKIVVSLSPFWFFERLTTRPDAYDGNFSALHAGELAFNTSLSLGLRQDAARRMLEFPSGLTGRPLLKFALEWLADGSPLGLTCYRAILPLGMIHNAILHCQDHGNALAYLWANPPKTPSPTSPRNRAELNWAKLHREAVSLYSAHSNNNEFGLDNEKWDRELRQETLRLRHRRRDEDFLDTLDRTTEWVDLELLLRELNEFGARPLLLSMPIHGGWYDACGITYAARRAYYQKLRDLSARYQTPVADFADHDADRSFCHDTMGHLAPNGLLYYGEVLDKFYHDAIPLPAELPAAEPVVSRGTQD